MDYTDATDLVQEVLGDDIMQKIAESNRTLAIFAAFLEDVTGDRDINSHSPHDQQVKLDAGDLPIEGDHRFYRITVTEITEEEYRKDPEEREE